MSSESRQQLLLVLLQEVTAAMRLQSEPEHLYTAASIAGFGAVAWGVASLDMTKHPSSIPLLVAAGGVLITALLVIVKLWHAHNHYSKFNDARIDVMRRLSNLNRDKNVFPPMMLEGKPGWGFAISISIVGVTGAAAVAFCLARIFFGA